MAYGSFDMCYDIESYYGSYVVMVRKKYDSHCTCSYSVWEVSYAAKYVRSHLDLHTKYEYDTDTFVFYFTCMLPFEQFYVW